MQIPLRFLAIFLTLLQLGRTAPRSSAGLILPFTWKEFISELNFPEEPKEEAKETPEPRNIPVQDISPEDLQQLLLTSSGLTPAQILQRALLESTQGRMLFGHKNNLDNIILVLGGGGGLYNNNTNIVNTNATATPAAATTTTGTRNTEFIRTPVFTQPAYPSAYPSGYPMQYFRKRQDDSFGTPVVSYPSVYGFNEAAFLGGGGGGGVGVDQSAGFQGFSGGFGGFSGGLPGVPLVPITIGNEVRYVPLNLRMLRQLPSPPVRENDDPMENPDDLSPFSIASEFEAEQANHEEDPAIEQAETPSGFGMLGQRFRERRRRPLQSIAQNIRRIQYLQK
ncbi:hypothetical protein KR009_002154 [Drosophila setifemur]|nr:hypothetical protein KR009_002154 [Drosophila setifemur]